MDDDLDLDRRPQREGGHADGRARVHARLAEDRAEQVGGPVDDARLPGEGRVGGDEADDLDDPLDPVEVAEIIHEAITTDTPKLRYAMSWGGAELVEGRARLDDADWVALGAIEDDAEYYDRFQEHFGLDIAPHH